MPESTDTLPACNQPECTNPDHLIGSLRKAVELSAEVNRGLHRSVALTTDVNQWLVRELGEIRALLRQACAYIPTGAAPPEWLDAVAAALRDRPE